MKHSEKAIYRQLLIGAILGTVVIIGVTLVILSFINPLVEFRDVTMPKSVMLTQHTGKVICQQMSLFALGSMYTCFDTEAEFDALVESR